MSDDGWGETSPAVAPAATPAFGAPAANDDPKKTLTQAAGDVAASKPSIVNGGSSFGEKASFGAASGGGEAGFGKSTSSFGASSAGDGSFGKSASGGGAAGFGGSSGGASSFGGSSGGAAGFGGSSGGAAGFGGSSGGGSGFGGSSGGGSGFGGKSSGGAGFGGSSGGGAGFGGSSGGGAGFGGSSSGGAGFGGSSGGGAGFGGSSGGGAGFGGSSGGGAGFGGSSGGATGFGSNSGGGSGFGGGSGGGSGFGGGSGGGSGFGGGSGGDRPRSNACYNCGGEGHRSNDCDQPRKPRGCYNCGEEGHRSNDCSQPRKAGGRSGGGAAFDGSSSGGGFGSSGGGGFGGSSGGGGFGGSSGGGGFGGSSGSGFGGSSGEGGLGGDAPRSSGCFNCGQEGHRSQECDQPRKSQDCFNCGQEGHRSAECTEPRKTRESEDPNWKPASTYVPEDTPEDVLFKDNIEKGSMFDRFFDAEVSVTRGGLDGSSAVISKISTFEELELTPRIRANVVQAGYSRPTPIQQHAIPIISSGGDMMACAQTGSGKTAAFLLPIMSKLMSEENLSNSGEGVCSPRCIIVAPTRELAVQIYNEGRKFAHGTVMYVKCLYGGTAVAVQKQDVSKGATVLVATTGRLKHFVEEGIISLEKVQYFVLDEADRMLDMGFGEDIRVLVGNSSMPPKTKRQTLLFSATFPTEVQTLAREFLKDEYLMITIDTVGAANKCITQEFINCQKNEKKDKLLELLKVDLDNYSTNKDADIFKQKTIIFVSKKTFCDALAAILIQAEIPCTTMHGDRLQAQRSDAIRQFKQGKVAILVTTAVGERGLDIKGVDHVINYDLPDTIDCYVHRIGRTGRVGNPGRATSFYVSEYNNGLACDLVKVLTQAGQIVPDWLEADGGSGAVGGFGQEEDDGGW